MFENVKSAIAEFESDITLKSDYTEELEILDGFKNDLAVLRTLGTPVWKIQDQLKEIARIREWIMQEIANTAVAEDGEEVSE
jgi:hypothetical protein